MQEPEREHMRQGTARTPRRSRGGRRGRRSPLATLALIAVGLFVTGGAYAGFTATSSASADSSLTNAQNIAHGKRLFQANCATCHGLALQGSASGPALIGVGAAAFDFQVRTGRMPLEQDAPQAQKHPVSFTATQVRDIVAYGASVSPGPGLPDPKYLKGDGNATLGARLFRTNCAMCHNVAGAGGALTEGKYAPSLKDSSPATIYEAMLTGPQSMPVFNDNNLTPQEKADIITSLKYNAAASQVAGFDLGSIGPVTEGLFLWIFGLGSIIAFTVWLTAKSN